MLLHEKAEALQEEVEELLRLPSDFPSIAGSSEKAWSCLTSIFKYEWFIVHIFIKYSLSFINEKIHFNYILRTVDDVWIYLSPFPLIIHLLQYLHIISLLKNLVSTTKWNPTASTYLQLTFIARPFIILLYIFSSN